MRLIVLGDKSEVGGLTRRLRSNLATPSDLLCPWLRWRRATCATSSRDHRTRCRHKLVREIRPDKPECRRIVRPVVRSQGTNFVVIRVWLLFGNEKTAKNQVILGVAAAEMAGNSRVIEVREEYPLV